MFDFTACTLHELFCKGEISAEQTVEAALERIAKGDGQVNAFLCVFTERVKEKARHLDRKRASGQAVGRLAGIPIAIKDNMHVKGELTTCASLFLSNYRALFDATVVRLLEEEDALIIGKTNLDEFAMGSSTENSAYQKTKNPWDLTCSPGGSSGGSAAAVAARFCPLALGSDTGGSIRQPASFCGIVGFKPTYGRVSRYGLVAFASSLDQIGPLATSVEDAALLMQVIGRHCSRDSTSLDIPSENYREKLHAFKGAKIGIPRSFLHQLPGDAKEHFFKTLEIIKSCDMTCVDIDLEILKHSVAAYYILSNAEASTNLARFDGVRYGNRSPRAETLDEVYELSKKEGFGPEVKRRILLGTFVLSSGYKDAYYKKALKVRTLIIDAFVRAFAHCDIIAMPTSPFTTFPLSTIKDPLEMYLQDIFTIAANLAGLPAISIPCAFSKDLKPYGLQLIGPQMHDTHVLTVAHAMEKAIDLQPKIPPLFG